MNYLLSVLLLLAIGVYSGYADNCNHTKVTEAFLPAVPNQFPEAISNLYADNFTSPLKPNPLKKIIARNIFISFRTKPNSLEELGEEHQSFFNKSRHDGWSIYTMGHDEQMSFLEKYYAGTSILWAAKIISREAGASISDIWRVAIVYAFGGLYIDDDSIITSSLENIVHENDEMIVSNDRSTFAHTCYHSDYHLSKQSLEKRFSPLFPNGISFHSIYGGRRVMQWAFFSRAKHPVLKRILENMVEVIRREYFQNPVVYILKFDPSWKNIICSTGPNLWTSSIIELYLENNQTLPSVRMIGGHDFHEFGGRFKVHNAKHFQKRLNHHYYNMRSTYLTDYHTVCIELLEKKLITSGNGWIYYVQGGQKRLLPDFDTLTSMNFSFVDPVIIRKVQDFDSIPIGPPIPSIYSIK